MRIALTIILLWYVAIYLFAEKLNTKVEAHNSKEAHTQIETIGYHDEAFDYFIFPCNGKYHPNGGPEESEPSHPPSEVPSRNTADTVLVLSRFNQF